MQLMRRHLANWWAAAAAPGCRQVPLRLTRRFRSSGAGARDGIGETDRTATAPKFFKRGTALHSPPVTLHVVGSSAMGSTTRRGATSNALRICRDVWLFDCGEGTQVQLMKSSKLSVGGVTKIFITHMHGDHVMGLPGLLSSLFGHSASADAIVEVFGPPGLRRFLHEVFAATFTTITVNFVVHELWGWAPQDLRDGAARFGGVDLPPVLRARDDDVAAAAAANDGDHDGGEDEDDKEDAQRAPAWWPSPVSPLERERAVEQERVARKEELRQKRYQRQRQRRQQPQQQLATSSSNSSDGGGGIGGLNIFPTHVSASSSSSSSSSPPGSRSRAQDYYWDLPLDDADSPAAQKFRVVAAPLVHSVPCLAYVVTEADTPGNVAMTPQLRARLEDPR